MGALADGCAAWLHDGSRVSGDVQARFCESLGVRFPGATHLVAGFENCGDAERFLQEWKDRLQKFGLELHPDKTRLIEFGRHAAENRKLLGEGKPEVFNFLGFTHMCGKTRKTGRFPGAALPPPLHFNSKQKVIIMTKQLTLLDELQQIDDALLNGEATEEQERRGQELVALADAAPAMLLALEAAEAAIEEATDIMLYEDGEPVTFLESWEIERAYGALVSVLVQVHEVIGKAKSTESTTDGRAAP